MQPLRLLPKHLSLSILCWFTVNGLATFICNAESRVIEQVITKKINIPVIEGGRIFAQFDDSLPAVINYFTSATETAVLSFYQKNYGEPIEKERKRGRLTVSYLQERQQIRVVISQQNNMRQVDIIVDKTTKHDR